MKHTPGPWKVVITPGGDTLIDTPRFRWSLGRLMSKADAHLIAAAPELLEALQRIIDYGGSLTGEDALEMVIIAKTAIAKAMGEG